jgi:hypothetical protein
MNIDDMLKQVCEESAEVTQAACKWMRFGPDSFHPGDNAQTPNKVLLAREIGNLLAIINLLGESGLCEQEIRFGMDEKIRKLEKYGYLKNGEPNQSISDL